MTFLKPLFGHTSSFFLWRDAIEIMAFAVTIYYISVWLSHDRQKNLLGYFYGYCALFFGASLLQLTTISCGLLLFSPALLMFFFLIHQSTLQKNFISLRNLTPKNYVATDWIETLMQTTLKALNNNREVICIIEQQDAMQPFLHTPLEFHADIKKGFLDLLFESQSFEHDKMVWINSRGIILGINAQWKEQAQLLFSEDQHTIGETWKHDALFFTSKSDALVVKTHVANRSFTFITKGKIYENIQATNAVHLFKKYIVAYHAHVTQGVAYETARSPHRTNQPNS